MAKFNRMCRAVSLALLLVANPGHACDPESTAGSGASEIDPKIAPTAELLEFLGDWDAGDEDWMGPEFFEKLEASDGEQKDDQKVD